MPRFTDVERALNAWRAAERRAADLLPGSPGRTDADAEVERLRSEYRSLTDAADSDVAGHGAERDEQRRTG